MRQAAWRRTALAVLSLGVCQSSLAAVDVGELTALRAAGRHGPAADLGLRAVLEQPWDHTLRYLVADSLERAGRLDEAASQFSALQGTPLQGAAQGRLTALAGRPNTAPAPAMPAAAPPPRPVVASTPPPQTTVATAPAPRPIVATPAITPAPPSAPPSSVTVASPPPSQANQTARAAPAPQPAAPATPRRLGSTATPAPAVAASTVVRPPTVAATPAATTASNQPRRLGSPAAETPSSNTAARPATLAGPPPVATATAQPRRLGSPASLAAPPPTATATATAQPRRLGSPASLAAPPPAATATASAQPRRLGSPASLAAPPPAATATATAQPRRLGSPASLAAPPPAATASAQPRRLGSPAGTPEAAAPQPRRLGAPASLASPASRSTAASQAAPSTPAQRIDALYARGEYAKVGEQGLALLEQGPIDPDLHLKVANSLAWSGKLEAGQAEYRALFGSKVDRDARLGLANTQRWNARFDLAMAGYQAVLDRNPDDSDALEGMKQSRLALAPRTTVGVEYTTDINPVERRGLTLGHRWHNDNGDTRFEVRLVRFEDSIRWVIPPFSINGSQSVALEPFAAVDRQSLSGTVELLAHPLQPQLTLSLRQQVVHPVEPALPLPGPQAGRTDDALFGTARIKLNDWPVWLRAGRLDWSHEALAPRASYSDLVARHSGLESQGDFGWGQLYGQLDYYSITDGNSVSAAQLRVTPSWRPLGSHWRPFAGVEFREAMRASPEYWSPALGHGSAFAGLSGDWSRGPVSIYGSAQYGVPLLEESGTSWSLSLGGRYQFAPDWALSFGFWRMSSFRDGAAYRARAANLQLEKVWR